MQYFSTRKYQDITIDVATAPIEDINDAYQSLFDHSDSAGAFPGSKAWTKAQPYAIALRDLTAARPEILDYRKAARTARTTKALAGKDVLGL